GEGAAETEATSRELLSELLPKIRELDPLWAKGLAKADPRVGAPRAAGDRSRGVALRYTSAPAVGEYLPAARDRARQIERLVRIQDLARRDPEAALRLCADLSDPVYRSKAFSAVAK